MIIGLSGYAQSGKDEVAKILIEEFGFERVAFADAIRNLLYEMNPNHHDTLLQQAVDRLGWDEVKKDPIVRRMLQNLGVGARKLFGEKFWIKEALRGIPKEGNFVFTDVRFINEADIIKSNDGKVWRVRREGVKAVNDHISEHELDDYKFDQILKNEGSLDDLRELVRKRITLSLDAN